MTEPIDILAHNTAAWNLQAAKDCDWSRPVDSAEIARARAGSWQARLTPGPLPAGWLDAASRAQKINGEEVEYGYMLWPLHGRSYAAEGIFGQYVFVDPAKQLVVVMLSAQAKPLNRAPLDEHTFLRALSAYFPDSSHK